MDGPRPETFEAIVRILGLEMIDPEIIGDIEQVEIIARGTSLRDRRRLAELYGEHRRHQWRKMKGFAVVRLPDGEVIRAEVHWYEADGIGRRELKVKNLLYNDC